MKDKFKVNFLIVLPAVILNIIVLSFIGGKGVQGAVYEYSLLNLIPYVSIIVLALIGINVIIVLTIGVVLGLIIGLINNSFTFIEMFFSSFKEVWAGWKIWRLYLLNNWWSCSYNAIFRRSRLFYLKT